MDTIKLNQTVDQLPFIFNEDSFSTRKYLFLNKNGEHHIAHMATRTDYTVTEDSVSLKLQTIYIDKYVHGIYAITEVGFADEHQKSTLQDLFIVGDLLHIPISQNDAKENLFKSFVNSGYKMLTIERCVNENDLQILLRVIKESSSRKQNQSGEKRFASIEIGSFVNQWKIMKKLGEGANNSVYQCCADGKMYALKTEGKEEKVQLLKMEVYILSELSKAKAAMHFCNIEDTGRHENFNYVVMTLVGKSLQELRSQQPKRRFSLGCAMSIGIQCLEALEDLHSIGYLHRDVSPANFAIGRDEFKELRKVYVLDFGMARKFVKKDGTTKTVSRVEGFRRTVRYAALSCHMSREMYQKDDIESWLYMCIELTRGKLPWRNLEDQDDVAEFKKKCRKEECVKQLFGGCPRQFIDIMKLLDSWKFFDQPDYSKIYKMMKEVIVSTKSEEYPYDWEPEAIKKAEETAKAQKAAGKKCSMSSVSDKDKKKAEESEKKKKKVEKEKKEKEESEKKESEKKCSEKKYSEKLKPAAASSEKLKNPRRSAK